MVVGVHLSSKTTYGHWGFLVIKRSSRMTEWAFSLSSCLDDIFIQFYMQFFKIFAIFIVGFWLGFYQPFWLSTGPDSHRNIFLPFCPPPSSLIDKSHCICNISLEQNNTSGLITLLVALKSKEAPCRVLPAPVQHLGPKTKQPRLVQLVKSRVVLCKAIAPR